MYDLWLPISWNRWEDSLPTGKPIYFYDSKYGPSFGRANFFHREIGSVKFWHKYRSWDSGLHMKVWGTKRRKKHFFSGEPQKPIPGYEQVCEKNSLWCYRIWTLEPDGLCLNQLSVTNMLYDTEQVTWPVCLGFFLCKIGLMMDTNNYRLLSELILKYTKVLECFPEHSEWY